MLPLVVLVLVLPRAARRWSMADWVLLGFGAGLGFQLFEDSARRVRWATRVPQAFESWITDDPMATYPQYGLGWGSGGQDFSAGSVQAVFPGHHLTCVVVAAAVGFAVLWWRARGPGWFLAPVLPVGAWWVVSCVHYGVNAGLAAWNWVGHPRRTTPELIIWTWNLTGQGRWIMPVALFAFLAAVWIDLARISPHLDGGAGQPQSWWGARFGGVPRIMLAQLPLWGYMRGPGQSRLAAMAAGATAAARTRQQRIDALAAGVARARWPGLGTRLVAGVGLLALLLGSLVVTPALAVQVGSWLTGSPLLWLAGLFSGLARWWGGLSGGEQALVLLAVGTAVGLLTCGLGPALYATGLASYGLGHARGLATFSRDPRLATRDYFLNTTPQRMVVDGVEAVTTMIPAGVGLFFGRGVKVAASRYASDPDAYRAAPKLMPSDAGQVRFDAFGLPRPNTWPGILADWRAGRAFNAHQNHRFEANEVTLLNKKRLDSYNHGSEIVSRKLSQLADLSPDTAKYYLQEITRKYPPGEIIADTTKARTEFPHLAGKELRGRMYLELPVQNKPVPPDILAYAKDCRIFIRDITGFIYRSP